MWGGGGESSLKGELRSTGAAVFAAAAAAAAAAAMGMPHILKQTHTLDNVLCVAVAVAPLAPSPQSAPKTTPPPHACLHTDSIKSEKTKFSIFTLRFGCSEARG